MKLANCTTQVSVDPTVLLEAWIQALWVLGRYSLYVSRFKRLLWDSRMIDLVINNGKLVYADATLNADIAIDNGKIIAIGSQRVFPKAERVIDAQGRFVFPGAIDPHVHINAPHVNTKRKHDFDTATISAALGGVTTFVDFAIQQKGQPPMEAIVAREKEAENKVAIDYSLHSIITDVTEESIGHIKDVVEHGVPSFKIFMALRKKGRMVDDGGILRVLEEVKKYRGLVGFHAENDAGVPAHLGSQGVLLGRRL